jgi:uncharacterized protein
VTFVLAFAGGLAGSLHCLGMCGGLAAIVAGAAGDRTGRRIALYNLGRVATLAAMGALAGGAGTALVAWGPLRAGERALAIVAGGVTIVVGLEQLGVLAPRGRRLAARLERGVAGALGSLVRARSPWTPLAFGTLNAFLPCHLIYAFAGIAASTGSIVAGWLTMLAFGLGTLPAMCAPGAIRAALPAQAGPRAARVLAALVVAVGVVTVLRGVGPAPHAH